MVILTILYLFNMRKIEIQAHSLDEAKLIAFQQGITVVQDLTRS